MSAISDQLLDYYANTIVAQYYNKPKAVATIRVLLGGSAGNGGSGQFGLLAGGLALQVRDGFDVQTAVGRQLDILGKYRGVSRYFSTLDLSKVFLQLPRYSDPSPGTYPGLASYHDAAQPPAIYTQRYDDFVQNTLQDGDFRRVILFKAAVDASDFSYAALDFICYTFFKQNVNLKVTGNMQITYQHLTSDTDNLFSIVSQMGLLPAPAGVSVATQEVAHF